MMYHITKNKLFCSILFPVYPQFSPAYHVGAGFIAPSADGDRITYHFGGFCFLFPLSAKHVHCGFIQLPVIKLIQNRPEAKVFCNQPEQCHGSTDLILAAIVADLTNGLLCVQQDFRRFQKIF